MEKEKSSWIATLFRYAEGQKAKLVISVILSVISVTSGLVPFYCMYRIICLFTDGIASSISIIGWCIGALAAYIVKVVLFTLSTGISQVAFLELAHGYNVYVQHFYYLYYCLYFSTR